MRLSRSTLAAALAAPLALALVANGGKSPGYGGSAWLRSSASVTLGR